MKPKRKTSSLFAPYLTDKEEPIWIGQPSPLQLLSRNDFLLIPFSLMWGGFAIFWEASALSSGAPSFFALWGIPFVLIGQYLIWGRFVYKYFKRQHTYYAITPQRVLVLNTLMRQSLDSHQIDQIPGISWQGHNLQFGQPKSLFSNHQGMNTWYGETQPGLYGLADATEVYHLLQDLMQQRKLKNTPAY